MAAGREVTPKDAAGVERLKEYWTTGEGGKLIGWDTPGDFTRCIECIQEAVTKGGREPLPDRMIKGLCAELHKRATGAAPGHGPREQTLSGKPGDRKR